jgi:hypothetical protein
MELLELPQALQKRNFMGWPQLYVVGRQDEAPPVGIPYIRAEKQDSALVFRVLIPLLKKQHPYFDWEAIYQELTGTKYCQQRIYVDTIEKNCSGHVYDQPSLRREQVTLLELSSDKMSYVDIDVLMQLAMIPTFFTDIREAIKVNVTNSWVWQDGYDKKRGLCTGTLVEQEPSRSLVILDISRSIPDGVSAGMLTLIKTITDITHADLILTGGKSFFYTNEEARMMDIHEERARIPRSNEGAMFREILYSHDMDYRTVISFGDSDAPGAIPLTGQRISTKQWYSFFVSKNDTYGNSYHAGVGYGRWVAENNPRVEIRHYTDWAKFFKGGRR